MDTAYVCSSTVSAVIKIKEESRDIKHPPYIGYAIKTDSSEHIVLKIEDMPGCCEEYGVRCLLVGGGDHKKYNIEDLIGRTLLSCKHYSNRHAELYTEGVELEFPGFKVRVELYTKLDSDYLCPSYRKTLVKYSGTPSFRINCKI